MENKTSKIYSCPIERVFRFSFGRRGRPWVQYYKMADFQRPYAWTQENIQKLLDDVDELRANLSGNDDLNNIYDTKNAPAYFLGSICLQHRTESKLKDAKSHYEVLDGQQRLTSLLILAYVLDKQVEDYKKGGEEGKECIRTEIAKRWDNDVVPYLAGRERNWRQLLVFTNPQSKKQIAKIYWSLMREYECLKKDASDDKSAKKEDEMNIFEQTLYQDVQRFEYILKKGSVAVLILENQTEAEQFFQGENNRGLPMSLLDLLKAYHVRQEVVRQGAVQSIEELNPITEISQLWYSFGFSVEDKKEESDQKKSNETEDFLFQKIQVPEKKRQLIARLVLPAMLMQYGIDPWSADRLENIALLKGMTGTYAGNRFIDEKVEDAKSGTKEDQRFDLRVPVCSGLPFFQELAQYLKLAQAVEFLLMKQENRSQEKEKQKDNEKNDEEKLVENRMIVLKLAMIAWADRFLKAEIMSSDCTWKDVAEALEKDVDFRIYSRNFVRFLDRLKTREKRKKGKKVRNGNQVGAYVTLRNETLCNIIQFSEPESNLIFLPHRSASPRECLRKFKAATYPGALRFTELRFYEGYRNAYDQEEF